MSPADANQTLTMEPVPPPSRPRRLWPALAAAVAGTLALTAIGLNLADRGGRVRTEGAVTTTLPPAAGPTPSTVVAPTTVPGGQPTATTVVPTTTVTTPPTPTTAPTTTPPERLSAASRLRLDGIGPVEVGMTPDQAAAASGMAFRSKGIDPYGVDCRFVFADGIDEFRFMVIAGRIARVDVGNPGASSVKTVSGIGRGSTEQDVMRTYPGRITVQGHPYVPSGHYLVYTPADRSLDHLSLIFETDGSVVTSFRSGLKGAVSQIEGCS